MLVICFSNNIVLRGRGFCTSSIAQITGNVPRLLADIVHDFIDSFSHGNNKRAGDLCKSTLVDDDSYDDRRTRLSFKAYDSDSGGGLIAPSSVMLQYTMQLGETFVKHFSNLQKVSCVGHDLLQLLEAFNLISLVTLLTKNIV